MKRWMTCVLLALAISSCSDSSTGDRTHNTMDNTTERPANSDPYPYERGPQDTSSGQAPDSSTVIGYDTSARTRHN